MLCAPSGLHCVVVINGSRTFMSQFRIIPFDVDTASRDTWAAFHAHRRDIAAELHPDDPVWSDAESEHEMRRASPLWENRRWLAFDGENLVGSCGAGFRRAGTPNAEEYAPFLNGWGSVVADARRKGIGTLLLRQVYGLMRDMDKSVLTMSADTDAGHAFLTHIGAAAKHCMLESRTLFKDIDWPCLRTWEDAAGSLGLVFECYAGRVPRETMVSLLPVLTALVADVPLGALETPPIRFEIESVDRWYEGMNRAEGAHHLVLLREPGGAVAGMSEASWDSRSPKSVYQSFTAIARPWRGRGLARAIKAAILRQIRCSHPAVEEMRTFNAESNTAILSVNKRLGFSMRRRHVDYQITRKELDAKLPGGGGT
jgi:GNAT superfamily N-acetyltransferase